MLSIGDTPDLPLVSVATFIDRPPSAVKVQLREAPASDFDLFDPPDQPSLAGTVSSTAASARGRTGG